MPAATATRKPVVKPSTAPKAAPRERTSPILGIGENNRYDPHADTDNIVLPDNELDLGSIIEGDTSAMRRGGDLKRFIATEKFMHDLLAITVSPPSGDQENPYAIVTVNHKVYEIPRGRVCRVPRFVVEALAHAKQANYKTKRTSIGDASHMAPVEGHVFSYPFVVKHDPAPEGGKWLQQVLNDPS